ncbi:hypothetical protein [uncultured Flavonifractor sp.]|uniref:hypothetical protein n=1 Tax=uncultured Flavonifractor sp. TaxID=1193534 RepID=UPI00262E6FFA|nr:hypothetical protein [uncultured Flavonifractor sp.]
MVDELGKVLADVGLASVGLVALAAEQVGKAGKILVEKGAVALEEGRKHGAELQRKYQEDAKRRREEQFNQRINEMTAQQREELRRRLAELDDLEREAAQADDIDDEDDTVSF